MKTKTNKTATKTTTKTTSKTIGELAKVIQARTTKQAIPATNKTYAGAPIPATKLYVRKMEGFSKDQGNACPAKMWMLINETTNTVTYANTYSIDEQPKASWKPEVYTYPIKPKVIEKKTAEMEEVEDREAWPTWVTFATPAKRTRKTTK